MHSMCAESNQMQMTHTKMCPLIKIRIKMLDLGDNLGLYSLLESPHMVIIIAI